MTKYTVVFLDINMGGMDGVATAKKIRSISKEIFIVFVTAYFDYTLEGYKVESHQYIVWERKIRVHEIHIEGKVKSRK